MVPKGDSEATLSKPILAQEARRATHDDPSAPQEAPNPPQEALRHLQRTRPCGLRVSDPPPTLELVGRVATAC